MKRIHSPLFLAASVAALLSTPFAVFPAEGPANTTSAAAASGTKTNETKIDPRVAARSIGIPEAEQLLSKNPRVVILDVRTEREFEAGHLAGAININSRATNFAALLGKLDRSKQYLVHSAGGGSRVTKTLEVFDGLGFTNWVNLAGGYAGWTNAAKPVVIVKSPGT